MIYHNKSTCGITTDATVSTYIAHFCHTMNQNDITFSFPSLYVLIQKRRDFWCVENAQDYTTAELFIRVQYVKRLFQCQELNF